MDHIIGKPTITGARSCSCGSILRRGESVYTHTLRDEDLTTAEQTAVSVMRYLFVSLESNGSCFDVLVQRAIELGEVEIRG
jgi:hypothetical protein